MDHDKDQLTLGVGTRLQHTQFGPGVPERRRRVRARAEPVARAEALLLRAVASDRRAPWQGNVGRLAVRQVQRRKGAAANRVRAGSRPVEIKRLSR